jgi:hypothetical protein
MMINLVHINYRQNSPLEPSWMIQLKYIMHEQKITGSEKCSRSDALIGIYFVLIN